MPADEVQHKAGTIVGNGGTTTPLDAATTAGNVVVIYVGHNTTITGPTGLTKIGPSSTEVGVYWKATAGGETTFTFPAPGASRIYSYLVVEYEGMDAGYPVDVVTQTFPGGATASALNRSTTFDGLAVAVWASLVTGTTVPTFSGQTNGFVEQDDHGTTNGTNAVGLSVASRPVQSLADWSSTATISAGTVHSLMVVFTAAGAKRDPIIDYFWSFLPELAGYPACRAASVAAGFTANQLFWAAQTGSPTIDANGLRLQGTATIQNIAGPNLLPASPKGGVQRIRLRINAAGGDLELARLESASADDVILTYRAASGKLGLQLGAGTEVLSDQTVATDASQWLDVDLRVNGETTAFTGSWRVNYGAGWVEQAPVSSTSGAVLGQWVPKLGWTAAATGDVSYAYAVYSLSLGHYPLGDYQAVLLGPDPNAVPAAVAGGSTANWRRFTANGTIDGSYNGPAIMAALDDWPPIFGGGADGLAAIAVDTGGLAIPMATYDAVGNGRRVRAVRVLVPFWAASATAATIGVLASVDGTNWTTLFSTADPNTDTGATPPWFVGGPFGGTWRPTNGWDQAKLDATQLRIISGDATPNSGPHALGLLVLVKLADSMLLFGEANAPLRVEQTIDPDTQGILGLYAYAPEDQGATLIFELNGVEQTPVDVPAGSNPLPIILDAADITVVNRITMIPGELVA